MDCPFCKIDSERTRIIKKGKHAFVVFSNPRLMKGHLLIIPKRHVEKISELNSAERKELFDLVVEFQEKILKNIAKGCDIRQNYRPFQKQTDFKIHHLHVHLQPRSLKDNLYKKMQIRETDIFKKITKKEVEEMKNKLK